MKKRTVIMSEESIGLADLLAGITVVDPIWDRQIGGITADSRAVKPGFLFIAFPGSQLDGRDFIHVAITQGASAIIAEGPSQDPRVIENIPVFYAKNLQQQVSKIAARFYGHPSRAMTLIGVTGTNGKTSITQLIGQCLQQAKKACGIMGTLGTGIYGQLQKGTHTTPDPIAVQAILADFSQHGVTTAAMEVSSHALDQARVRQVQFKIGVFTNLTRDHLDYHETMEAYAGAKQKLFQQFGLEHAVLNADDAFSADIQRQLPPGVKAWRYGIQTKDADIWADSVHYTSAGITAMITTPWGKGELSLPLLGEFNLSNALAVITCLGLMKFSWVTIVDMMSKVTGVPGRMQPYHLPGSPTFIIDYAHTPDALEQVLHALRKHNPERLICVYGCGGDRDPGKRPLMGRIAESLATHTIITNDNPRTESPEKIAEVILQGYQHPKSAEVILDRKQAIYAALKQATERDIILIAGKGHEDYQIIGHETTHFSDLECVIQVLNTASR